MTTIAKIQPGAMALPVAPVEPSADLSALIAAVQRGIPMTVRDLTPVLVSEARAIAEGQNANAPAQEIIIAAWVKKLIPLTVNPPTDPADSAAKISAICEICGDMPAAVWTPETRKAWVTQGPQGKFWPSPAELCAHLQPYADKLRRSVEGCRRIVRLAERAGKREEGVSAEERAAVARKMAEWRKERGYLDPPTEQRRPVEPQPSVSERLAECRRQLAADPTQGVWLEPLIAQLEAQVMSTCGKEPTGRPHSAAQVFAR